MLPLFSLLMAPVDPAAIYQKHCAACHDAAENVAEGRRAPAGSALASLKPEAILTALTTGSMAAQGKALTAEERAALAAFLTGKPGGSAPGAGYKMCPADAAPAVNGEWNGWAGPAGLRYQPNPGFKAEDAVRLKLKWSFAIPNASMATAKPVIVRGLVSGGRFAAHRRSTRGAGCSMPRPGTAM